MPSAPVTNSAYVPKPIAVVRKALEQEIEAMPKPEFHPVDPVERFKNILTEGQKIAEQTGLPPPGVLHKIER